MNYEKVNLKVEKWSRISYVAFMHVTYPVVFIPKLLLSFYIYFTDRESEAFFLNYPMWMPFDWKTPYGYLITLCVQVPTWFFLLLNCSCVICLFAGSCWLLSSYIESIDGHLHTLNQANKQNVSMENAFFRIIRTHSNAKQLANDLSDIYDIIITGYYLWSLITICTTLLVIRVMMLNNGKMMDILFASTMIFWAFIQMFYICDLGENVTTYFSQIEDKIYSCDWYLFPMKIQKLLPIVLMSGEKPVIIQGFANLKCTRDAFKKVVQGGFSYFMTLQQFTR
ncbi:odorant receptor coreceptor-like [Contarinia nasturtii]|uniref:odorant receptor coreceptor-like n=1 Tax=Contarinia nasturtii TaxID=265458 RepID=UPI0012D38A12|nr:odorant receptor coreceptor-like [Contarinia nasturtii]